MRSITVLARRKFCRGRPLAVRPFSSVVTASLPALGDAELEDLLAASGGRPLLLHCGAPWSARSKALVERLVEWGNASGDSGVLLASANVEVAPRLVEKRHIRVVPTLLLVQDGKTHHRADGGEDNAVARVFAAAEAYNPESSIVGASDPCLVVHAADEVLRQSAAVEHGPVEAAAAWQRAERMYRQVLGHDGSNSAFAFRARLGLLRCAISQGLVAVDAKGAEATVEAADSVAALLTELGELHREEFECDTRADGAPLARFITHAELLADAWKGEATSAEEKLVLGHYAAGRVEAALSEALTWYQSEAAGDIAGLVEAYCLPPRRLSDRPGDLPPSSIYSAEGLAEGVEGLPGPAGPRSILRRLFGALDPASEDVRKALAELEFLLDRKKWVPFHTRQLTTRRGGAPNAGRGTGSGSGYSKPYWIDYGPERAYKNTKPMGGPHTNSYDGW